ncbi:uncharacterized protein PADG_11040 [Paracoccidioides brasiliensis Pb18]|uniref:Uncharacterized protein n=1 Tax=Paracoccidioides brasiliensis (strain Pb18) TaxID=502780 RepID=A0A0A0HZ08_PARBD|nr:uncharacterized protein PADG_11040 [Paracoccidioides brasiliensis Pb18]KGM92595.1 hypothetical protein PADG_11040 [Paracoccidioides brasiliensis Pb18]
MIGHDRKPAVRVRKVHVEQMWRLKWKFHPELSSCSLANIMELDPFFYRLQGNLTKRLDFEFLNWVEIGQFDNLENRQVENWKWYRMAPRQPRCITQRVRSNNGPIVVDPGLDNNSSTFAESSLDFQVSCSLSDAPLIAPQG